MKVAKIADTFPSPKKNIAGIKYTKLGIVCIASRIGRIIFDIILLNDIHTPIGIPTINEILTAANIIAIVVIISPHKQNVHIKLINIIIITTHKPNIPNKKINIPKITHDKSD